MEGSAEKALLQASILIETYWNVNDICASAEPGMKLY